MTNVACSHHSLGAPSFNSSDMNTYPVVTSETKKVICNHCQDGAWEAVERGVTGDHQSGERGSSLWKQREVNREEVQRRVKGNWRDTSDVIGEQRKEGFFREWGERQIEKKEGSRQNENIDG